MKKLLVTGITAALFVFMGCTEDKEEQKTPSEAKKVFITENSKESGLFAIIDSGVYIKGATIHSDAVAKISGNNIFILERYEADNIVKLTENGGKIAYQKHISDGWNPHDLITISESKGYVCGNNASNLLIFNPVTGDSIGSIDLSKYVFNPEKNTSPNATVMRVVDNKLYVALQRRDGFVPGGETQVLEIDVTNNSVTKVISCTGKNVSDMEYFNGALYVVNFGGYSTTYGANGDAAVEKIDLSDYSVTTVLEGTILGGDIQDIEFKDENSFYFSSYKVWGNAPVALYDMTSKTVADTITAITQSAGLQWDENANKLYILEGSADKAGVIVYDAVKDSSTTIKTTLTPSSIALQ